MSHSGLLHAPHRVRSPSPRRARPASSFAAAARRLLACTPLLLACTPLFACAPPAPVPASPPSPSGQPAAPPPSSVASAAPALPSLPVDPLTLSVVLVKGPEKLALDGEVAEWGSLEPPREATQTHVAGSHLAVAIRPTDVVLAAQLGETAKDGFWLTLGDKAPDIAKIGDEARGSFTADLECEYKKVFVGDGQMVNGPRNLPEVIAACKALLARHVQLVAKHEERFLRRYKVDREGVRVLGPAGALTPVEGAQIVFKPAEKGASSLEVSLPLAALPRLTQAPLVSIGLAVDLAGPTPPPAPTQDALGHFNLPEPVAFEPWGELRSKVLAGIGTTFFPAGMSYQPGDPLHIETFRYPEKDRHSVLPVVDTLYEKKASLGDIEVGLSSVYGAQILSIFQKGKLLSVIPRDPDLPAVDIGAKTRFMGVIQRDGELHAFLFSEQSLTMATGFQNPTWYAFAIAPDGQYRVVVDGSADDIPQWTEAWEITSPDMDTFGVRGATHYPQGMESPKNDVAGVEILYRWDATQKKYKSTKKLIPAPKRPKKTK